MNNAIDLDCCDTGAQRLAGNIQHLSPHATRMTQANVSVQLVGRVYAYVGMTLLVVLLHHANSGNVVRVIWFPNMGRYLPTRTVECRSQRSRESVIVGPVGERMFDVVRCIFWTRDTVTGWRLAVFRTAHKYTIRETIRGQKQFSKPPITGGRTWMQ